MKTLLTLLVLSLFACSPEIPKRSTTPEKIPNKEKLESAVSKLKELMELEPDQDIKNKVYAWLQKVKIGSITKYIRNGDSYTFTYGKGTNPEDEVLILEVPESLMQNTAGAHASMMYNPDLSGGRKHVFANVSDLSKGTIEETVFRIYHELIHVYQYHVSIEKEKYFPAPISLQNSMSKFLKDNARFNRELMASKKTSDLFMLVHPEFQSVTSECDCDKKIGPQLNRLIKKIGDKETAGKVVENACTEEWVRQIVLR
ncbi:MAG: hypothetical protein AAB438_00260 [Patescibacteria group bacterium]